MKKITKRLTKVIALLMAVSLIGMLMTGTALAKPNKADQDRNINITFQDINGHWAQNDIMASVKKGIVKGYPDGTFQPDKPVTQNEAIAIIMNAVDQQSSVTGSVYGNVFPAWMQNVAVQALEKNILTDQDLINWNGNAPAKRIEVAMWISRAMDNSVGTVNSSLPFVDLNGVSDADKSCISYLYSKGIMHGYPGLIFQPFKPVTRAEMAVMLLKVLNCTPGVNTSTPVDGQTVVYSKIVSGDITAVDNQKITVAQGDVSIVTSSGNSSTSVQTQTYTLATGAKVLLNGQVTTLDKLPVGAITTIYLNNQNLAVQVAAKNS